MSHKKRIGGVIMKKDNEHENDDDYFYYCAICNAKIKLDEFCPNNHDYIADWYGHGRYEGD